MSFFTNAGNQFGTAITGWLQDVRLLSEAAFRLYLDHQQKGLIKFSQSSWPKSNKGKVPLPFEIKPVPLAQRMDCLLKTLWRSQFIFLETLWEEYLQALVLELRLKDASIFEPFCEHKFMAGMVRDVLAGQLLSIDEIKDEAAARFAAGLTRSPWKEQWNQLERLEIGLSEKDESQPWFNDLDIYFEERNCIIHRKGRVSSLLNQKTSWYKDKQIKEIEIFPENLDFYRRRFLDCVGYIESKIEAKFKPKSVGLAGAE
jgi:hypothetical protein